MREIAECESKSRHWDDKGEVLIGTASATEDTGLFQISLYWHEKTAKDMGIDIYSLEGNVEYAQILYKKNGTKDWNASKDCWSK